MTKGGRYSGRLKVVGVDMMCFAVNVITLEAETTSAYDPYAWTHPDDSVETISVSEWQLRRDNMGIGPNSLWNQT